MRKTGSRRDSPDEESHSLKAIAIRVGVLVAVFAVLAFVFASRSFGQGAPLDAIESGPVGLAGMLAGMLIFALAALLNHHRNSRDLAARVAELEAALESRDDRIWSLEERLARATELVDAQGDLVVREDGDGRVTHASAAACALLGKNLGDILGRQARFDVRSEGVRLTQPDGSVAFDQEIATPDGPRWIAWKEATMRDEQGRVVERQRVGRDVTARVAAEHALADAREKAEAASRAKSRFLAVVSHEFRTPLNGILGMTSLLGETALSPEQQTYARAIKTSGEALLALIEEVLDFSKIEAGRLDLEAAPFELCAAVTDVVELIAPRAQARGIEIAIDFDDGLPRRVIGDAARLRQVLLNLAGNAVKFTNEGGVAVTVERTADRRVRFEVSDTGPGIGDHERARIFREFEQGDASLARRHGGTGLGLAIAARLVERMGGEISLHNNPRGGAIFRFELELPEVDATAEPTPDLRETAVLVVSPSPVVGPLLERRLAAWGAQVTLATSDAVAASVLPERHWDHVLVDRGLGPNSTFLLAEAARQHARYRHVLLAPAERGELTELRAAGFNGYLVKPVRAASLASRLTAPDAAPSLVPEPEHAGIEGGGTGRSLSVLVVEDNDINAMLVQALLRKLGHVASLATEGTSAVHAVATAHALGAPYDVVLMDLHLPGMDGLEATRRIRALGGGAGEVPVVALTANAFPEDRQACLAAGMDAFVVKPVDRGRLEEAMATAIAARTGAESTDDRLVDSAVR